MRDLDVSTIGDAFKGPNTDTRQWISQGLVDADTPDARSVLFDDEDGQELPYPLVMVTLQPSGVTLPCRVGAQAAGDGESDWAPFVAGDEVTVLLPGGDEREGGIIVCRTNQRRDKFPRKVAGQDVTKNTTAFRRMRTPYLFECATGYVCRNATTGASFTLDPEGKVILNSGDKHALIMSADVVTLQTGGDECSVQLDPDKGTVALFAKETSLVLSPDETKLMAKGTVSIGTSGAAALDHVATVEGVCNILVNVFQLLSIPMAAMVAPTPGAAIGALFASPAFATMLAGALAVAGAGGLNPVLGTAIGGALSIPKLPGNPGIGCAGFMVGVYDAGQHAGVRADDSIHLRWMRGPCDVIPQVAEVLWP